MDHSELEARIGEVLGRRRGRRVPYPPLGDQLVSRCNKARAALGMSLRGFAEVLGVNPGTVHRWEAGGGCAEWYAARYATAVLLLEDRISAG